MGSPVGNAMFIVCPVPPVVADPMDTPFLYNWNTTTPTAGLDNFNDHQSVDVAAIPVSKVTLPPALSTTKRQFGLKLGFNNTSSAPGPPNAFRPTP
jgi:hypothetical protein